MVCGEADGAHSAFHAIDHVTADIVVLDISLKGPDGLDVLKDNPHEDSRTCPC